MKRTKLVFWLTVFVMLILAPSSTPVRADTPVDWDVKEPATVLVCTMENMVHEVAPIAAPNVVAVYEETALVLGFDECREFPLDGETATQIGNREGAKIFGDDFRLYLR